LERFTTIRVLLGMCVFVAVGSVVMAILKRPEAYPLGDMSDEFGPSRLIGMAWHPGILGYSCAIALAAAMWWPTISRRKFLTTGISIVVAGASLYCLFVADSRTGEVAALLTIATGFVMPWLERFCATKVPRRFLKVVATLAVLAMFLTPVLFGFLSGGQLTTTTYSDKGQSVRTASVDEREKIWRDMPVAFASNPVTGTGFGADGPLVRGYNPTVGYVTDKRLPFYHSLLVNCLATSGAIGFLAGLWLLLSGALSAVDRLSEVNIERAKVDPLGIANVRAAVLILMATYPFAAAEGALQGDYTSYVVGLIALATLYPLHSNKSNLPLHRPKPRQRRRAPAEQLAAAGS
jgi:O-antigen ligase